MIDPTAKNLLFMLYRSIPDNWFGLRILHVMGWLASKQRPANATVRRIGVPVTGRTIDLHIVAPKDAKGPLPVVLHLHGGGYAIGRPDQDLALLGHYIGLKPAIFVAPRYRLSAEAPYPAAIDDCYAALVWLAANADTIGGDASRLFVMGESAGGGLVAALTLRARECGAVAIAGQFPLYGMLDDRAERYTDRPRDVLSWSRETNLLAWQTYLGDRFGGSDVPPDAAPARATDLSGLPPAYGMVGDQDLFLDQNVEYFSRLAAAGVPTKFKVFPGAYHAAELLAPRSIVGRDMREWLDAAYIEALETLRADQPDV